MDDPSQGRIEQDGAKNQALNNLYSSQEMVPKIIQAKNMNNLYVNHWFCLYAIDDTNSMQELFIFFDKPTYSVFNDISQ